MTVDAALLLAFWNLHRERHRWEGRMRLTCRTPQQVVGLDATVSLCICDLALAISKRFGVLP